MFLQRKWFLTPPFLRLLHFYHHQSNLKQQQTWNDKVIKHQLTPTQLTSSHLSVKSQHHMPKQISYTTKICFISTHTNILTLLLTNHYNMHMHNHHQPNKQDTWANIEQIIIIIINKYICSRILVSLPFRVLYSTDKCT